MDDLNLPENLLLLALDDESGERLASYVDYALGGAAFAELILRERLVVSTRKGDRYELADTTPTGDAFLDRCFEIIQSKGVEKDPKQLISAIGQKRGVSAPLVNGLVDRGVLHRRTKKVFFFFEKTIYPEANSAIETALKERLARVLFYDETPSARDTVLIALASSLNLLKRNFDRELLSINKARINEIVAGDHLVADATRKAIEAVKAAVAVATIMPAVVITSAG